MLLRVDHVAAVLNISPFTSEANALSRALSGAKWLKYGEGLQFEPTEKNISIVKQTIENLTVKDNRSRSLDWQNFGPRAPYVPKTELRSYQREALQKLGANKVFALFMDVGTGKTKIGLDWAGYLFATRQISGMIVVAPDGVHEQWIESAFPRHAGMPYQAFVWPLKQMDRAMLPGEALKVLTINWDAILYQRHGKDGVIKQMAGFKCLLQFLDYHKGRVLFVADESHRMKNSRSTTHKSMMRLAPLCSHRMLMTGTPIAKNLLDEWAQFTWLDTNIIGIKYKTYFIAEYCLKGGYKDKEIVGHRNVEKYRAKIEPYTFIITKKDIGRVDPSVEFWHYDLTIEQRKLIKQISDEQIVALAEGNFTVANAAVAVNKIQQVAGGFYLQDGEKVWRANLIANPRLLALKKFLDSRDDEKIIIWARYRADLDGIKAMLGDAAVLYDGEGKAAAKAAFLDSAGGIQYFIANPATGGTGIDGLQTVCTTDIFYSMNDNYIQKIQAEGRIDRDGSIGPITHFYLIGRGTFDLKIYKRHEQKRDIWTLAHGEWEKFFSQEDEKLWSDAAG